MAPLVRCGRWGVNPEGPVVLGIDGVHDAPLRFAIDEARRRGVGLRIVHGAAMPVAQMELCLSHATVGEILSEGQHVLDETCRLVDHLAPDIRVEYVLTTDLPAEVLTTESRTAQLLVVGADDVSWFDRVAGGAVADRVARHAACPVVVVPAQEPRRDRHEGVVAALDGTSGARPLMRLALDLAQDWGCAFHALMVVPVTATPEAVDRARAGLGEVVAGWAEAYPDVRIEQHLVIGSPDEACLDATRHAEILLVGRSKDRGLQRATVADVLHRTECPVVVVPLGGRHG